MEKTQAVTSITDQFLNKALDYLSSAEAFLKAEVPAFVQEILLYSFYESALILSVGLLFLILGIYIARKIKTKSDIPATVAIFVGFIIVVVNIDTMIKIKVAPRLFLIQKITRIVK